MGEYRDEIKVVVVISLHELEFSLIAFVYGVGVMMHKSVAID